MHNDKKMSDFTALQQQLNKKLSEGESKADDKAGTEAAETAEESALGQKLPTDGSVNDAEPGTAPHEDAAEPKKSAAGQSSGKKVGRPKKADAKAVSAPRRREKKEATAAGTRTDAPIATTTIREDVAAMLRYHKAVTRIPIYDTVSDACENYIRYTYHCCDPNCGATFTMVAGDEGALDPSCCPVCGGKKLDQEKFQFRF